MDKNYFKKLRVMDGGMGQELHAKGLISKGTLWSTSATVSYTHLTLPTKA